MADLSRGLANLKRYDLLGSLSRFGARSYAQDYIGLSIIIVLYLLLLLVTEPFHRMFALDDKAIQFPHAVEERVTPGMLIIYAGATPLAIITIWAVLLAPGYHKLHVTYLGLLLSVFVTVFLTDIIKNFVGRPRPDLVSRCRPGANAPKHQLVDIHVCTQADHHILHDGWRSFPSGHSSFSFSGLGYLALFVASQTRALHRHTPLPLTFLALLPLIAALLIAISRCEDYRHDVWDVTAGSIMGFIIAFTVFRRYYPSLTSRHCETPYPSREEIGMRRFTQVGGRGRRQDEEETIGLTEMIVPGPERFSGEVADDERMAQQRATLNASREYLNASPRPGSREPGNRSDAR